VTGASAHRDVPPDHWAYKAIDELERAGVMKGFPDGTFKGRKIVTRYEMAETVARVLARATELTRAGVKITPEDTLRINRLTREFQTELELHGVRIEALEKRVEKVEKKAATLEATLSNVRIEGFYRLENTFVSTAFNYTNYPFDVTKNPFTGFASPGLFPLSQEAFLRFIGSPFIAGTLFKNVEAFAELRAKVTGPTLGNPRLEYKFSNPPIAGDNLDDFATNIVDEQRVQVDKAHFISRAKLAAVRAFSNESMTDFTDPGVLLTVDSFDPAPFSGVEVNGSIKKMSYFGSVLKFISLSPSPFPNGNNPLDLNEFFTPLSRTQNDIFSFRMIYEPYRRKTGKGPTNLTIGTSYVEKVFSYDVKNNFDRVYAVDLTLSHEGKDEKLDLTLEPQFTFGIDPALLPVEGIANQDIAGNAFRLDSSYSYKKFLANLKAYSFTKFFRIATGARQFVDHNLPPYRDNFRRRNNPFDPFDPAESLIRLNLRWDLGDRVFRNVKSLTLSVLGEAKEWADNPGAPRFDDESEAYRWFIQTIADFTDRTHVELIHEEQFHLPPNALFAGRLQLIKPVEVSKLTVDFKATKHSSFIGELELIDDLNRDAIGPDGRHFSLERSRIQVNSQTNKYLFISGFAEQIRNALQRRFLDPNGNIIRPLIRNAQRVLRPQRNGLDIRVIGAETNLAIFDNKAAFKTFLLRETDRDRFDPTLDGTSDVAVFELSANWTRALKGRYQYGFQDHNLVNRQDIFFVNNFLEIIYTPSEKTELRFTFGYEYENADDRFDDGPYLFFKTEKLFQITAHTDF
jgi:hypothetical protein